MSRSADAEAAADDAAEEAASTTSRMAQSEAPQAPAPLPRSRARADGAAGSCTRAAAVALRQLSKLFTCSHDDEDEEEEDAAAFFVDWARCCWYCGRFLAAAATLGLFMDDAATAMPRWLRAPGGVLGADESDGCGDGGGFFLRLLPWWWSRRRLSEWSPAAALLAVEAEEEEGSRRVARAMYE